MKEIRNLTKKPLRVPLPRGRTLHLGPAQTAQVADKAIELKGLQKLVEAEQIEVLGEGAKVATKKGAGDNSTRQKGVSSSVRRMQGDR